MKLFFREKFHCNLSEQKTGGLESSNFDFCVVNFDTMKLIFYAIMSKTIIPQSFLDIEKERKLQYLWYHNFRSYVVEARGVVSLWCRSVKPSRATVHRTVALKWVRLPIFVLTKK